MNIHTYIHTYKHINIQKHNTNKQVNTTQTQNTYRNLFVQDGGFLRSQAVQFQPFLEVLAILSILINVRRGKCTASVSTYTFIITMYICANHTYIPLLQQIE